MLTKAKLLKRNLFKNPWLALLGMGLVSFLGCVDFTSVNTILPQIQTQFNVPITQLQWVINIFMLALATCMVFAGQLEDSLGSAFMLYMGMILLATSSLGAGLSENIMMLIFFRLLQGISVAILYTAPIALVPRLFPSNLQSRAIGSLVSINALGLALGPFFGGIIGSILSWRYVFLVSIPFIILSALICAFTLPHNNKNISIKKIDWKGLALLITSLPALLLAISAKNQLEVDTLLLYIISFCLLSLFVKVEKKAEQPILNLDFFLLRNFTFGITANFFLAFFYTVSLFLIPLYLHTVMQLKLYTISLVLLPITGTMALLSPFIDYAIKSIGLRKILVIGFVCFAASSFIQAILTQQFTIIYMIISCLLFGIGWACILGPSIVATVSSVPKSSSGMAIGTLGTIHNFGGAVGLTISLAFYDLFNRTQLLNSGQVFKNNCHLLPISPSGFISGYHSAMWLLTGISCLAIFLVSAGIKNNQ
ncbi:MAG: MFS transporter [Gammaproteobacteria bacterium]|nr:MFS transporter [Gammaproteobacteria bacterium]